MTTPSKSFNVERRALLDQIAAITTMQSGTLAEEWRERPDPTGEGVVRLGPYYKHQVWKDGRNISRRVPASEAQLLREDIDNAKRFERLTDQLAELNIEQTLALRAAEASQPDGDGCKKNSIRKRAANGSPKPRRSSNGPRRS